MATGDSRLAQMVRDFGRIKERVETLTGERGANDRAMSAVRRGELRPLATLAEDMKSAQITAAPTQADYNALQKDVAALYGAMVLLSNLLGNAKIPKG
jgi:hypothetical protein